LQDPAGARLTGLSSLVLCEPAELLPPQVATVCGLLAEHGLHLQHAPELETDAAATPLAHEPVLIIAEDEWTAAAALVERMLPCPAPEGQALLLSSDSRVLDHALHAAGLPRTGAGAYSCERGALQLLPLLLENAWWPVELHSLTELLSLEAFPVPAFAKRALLFAVSREAGVGGAAWQEAMNQIKQDCAERELPPGIADELEQFLGAAGRVKPAEGISGAQVAARCDWLLSRLERAQAAAQGAAAGPAGAGAGAAVAAAVRHTRLLKQLCAEAGQLSRVALERMLGDVLGSGQPAGDYPAEAAPWRVYRHPGQLRNACQTLYWWEFAEAPPSRGATWSPAERRYLSSRGVRLEEPEAVYRRENDACMRAALHAQEQLVLVHVRFKNGEEQKMHPFLQRLESLGTVRAETASSTRTAASRAAGEAPSRRALFQVPPGQVSVSGDMSYSGLSSLLGCPLNWLCSQHLRLRSGRALTLQSGNLLLGNLCHKVVEELLGSGATVPEPAAARAAAEAEFDRLLPFIAAELLLPEHEAERRRAREAVGLAIAELSAGLLRYGLSPVAVEHEFAAGGQELTLHGRIDLVLQDRSGRPYLLDFKWSNAANWYKDAVEQGEALQLAVYAHAIEHTGHADPAGGTQHTELGAGYYLLAQRRFLWATPAYDSGAGAGNGAGNAAGSAAAGNATSPAGLASAGAEPPPEISLDETFARAVRGRARIAAEIAQGRVAATGVRERELQSQDSLSDGKLTKQMRDEAAARGELYVSPPCGFCEFGAVCGMNRSAL